jgi:predicted SprT family Zn-dependent metalloprotease
MRGSLPPGLRRDVARGQLLLFEPFRPPDPAREEPDLEAVFAELNHRFFAGRLRATVVWSHRLTASAGDCSVRRRRIRVSAIHHAKRPEMLRATLAHEMCHLLVQDHGPAFRALAEPIARALGVSWEDFRYAEDYADMRRYRYVYGCAACGFELPSRKRRTVSCPYCGGKEYSEAHRLALVESRARPGPVLRGERPARSR